MKKLFKSVRRSPKYLHRVYTPLHHPISQYEHHLITSLRRSLFLFVVLDRASLINLEEWPLLRHLNTA